MEANNPQVKHAGKVIILRDILAGQRTVLANQRTLFSLIRTVLSIWGAGVLLIKLADHHTLVVTGWFLLPFGGAMLIWGLLSYRHRARIIAQETKGDVQRETGGPPSAVLS